MDEIIGLKMKDTFRVYISLLVLFSFFSCHAIEVDSIESKLTTRVLLNNSLQVNLPGLEFKKIKRRDLSRFYKTYFKSSNASAMDGFLFSKNCLLRFYSTETVFPIGVMDDLEIWEIISKFTDKLPGTRWKESGWSRTTSGRIYYYVRLTDSNSKTGFSELVLFKINDRVGICYFQCSTDELSEWDSYFNEMKSKMSFIEPNGIHRPRFVRF
jgi:hypothetical protein